MTKNSQTNQTNVYEMDIECINNNNIEKTVSIYLSPAIYF